MAAKAGGVCVDPTLLTAPELKVVDKWCMYITKVVSHIMLITTNQKIKKDKRLLFYINYEYA